MGAERLNLRTRTSRTYATGARQLTTLIYSDSINFQDRAGSWQPIDDSLVKTNAAHYAYQNRANRYAVYLPADMATAPTRVAVGSSWLTFALKGGKGPGAISGGVATYRNALPGVTVVAAAQSDAVEESLVLEGPASPSEFTYELQMSPGLKLNTAGNSVSVIDAAGQPIFVLAAPAMYDSSGSVAGRSSAIAMTAATDNKATTLTLKADAAWLANTARKWPVTIDPTVIVADSQDCYLVGGASAGTSFCGGATLNSGYDGTAASRALLKFNLQAIPTTNTVVSARLLLFLGSASTSTTTSLSLYQLTRSWTSAASWNKYDGVNSWTTPGGDFSASASATTSGIAKTGLYYSFTPTQLVQGWVNGTIANNGLLVKEPTENVANVLSFNSATASNPPYLQVVHQQGGATPGSYFAAVLGDNPVAYWHLDETSGSTMADARNVDSGTYQGGYTLAQPSLIQPAAGNSVSFNGSTGYATAPTLTALQADNTRSVELWFSTTNNGGEPLFDSGTQGGPNGAMFNLQLTGQNTVASNPPSPNSPGLYLVMWGEDIYIPGLYLADGKRHQVVVELSGSSLWIYVDNATPGGYLNVGGWNTRYLLSQPFSLPTTPNTTANPILIGNTRTFEGGSTNFFQGQFDEVAVYSSVLTATQVQKHWQAGNGLPWSPTNVTGASGAHSVTVSWTAPTFNAAAITGYVVTPQVGSNLRTPITYNSSATSETVSNLSGGTAYTFTVTAINSLGLGIPSTASSAVTPSGSAMPLYEDTVLADSPVGLWPLGESSGSSATDLTQTFDGTEAGAYVHGDAGPTVNVGNKATSFAGSNSFVRLDHTTLLEPAAVTVEVWIKPSSVPTNDSPIFVSPQSGNGEWSTNGYVMTYGGANGLSPGKVSWQGIASAATLPTGVWSYVVGVSDSTATRIYVNGKQSSSVGGGGPNYGGAPNFDALITRFGLPGDIADVAVYGSALTASQISAHYAAAGYAPGPVSNLAATASTNSASLTWTAPSYAGTSPISSYTVTPIVDGKASTPITVGGNGTGANIPNLPGGASYTFQVQANNSSGAAVTVTSSAVTIGSPAVGPGNFGTYLYMRGGPGNGQAFSHYGFVSRNNAAAMSSWTLEERLWGFNSMANTGSHAALGMLSGTTDSPSDQNPVAGLNFNIGGSPLQSYFVWPGGSCTIPTDIQGLPSAIDAAVTTPAHVALTYDGSTVRGFINGVLVSGCSIATGAAALPAGPFGFMDNAGINQAAFDEIRVSNTARYTSNFTAPTQQFTTDGNTMILWRFNDYPISKLPSTRILSRDGDGIGGYNGALIPSTYRDSSGNTNHANTVWSSGWSSVIGDLDWRRPYSLGQGVTADELTGGESPWLCPCTISSTARPVNDETGEFWHTFTDFHIPGRMDLDFTRTYSSLRTATLGPTGYGWTDKYNQYLSFDGSGNATVYASNGSAVVFTYTAPSTYTGPPSEHVSLVKNEDSTFTLTDTGHYQTVFNAAVGNKSTLQKLIDRHGGTAYTLTLAYNGDGTLATVTDPAGRTLTFIYQTIGTNKLIQGITDTASPARSVSFQYGTNSSDPTTYLSLTQVTDVGGGLTKFTYDSNHYLLTMTDPNNGVTTNVYDSGTHQVTSQTDPMNRRTTFAYSGGFTTVTDPKGNVVSEEYLNGILISRTSGVGTPQQATWTYSFDPSALAMTASVGPNGETATAVRDANANVLSSTDGLGRTTTSTYNSFSEPLTITDPLGVTTTNTYNATGDLLTSSRPLVGSGQTATTSYTHGDAQHPGDATQMTDPDLKVWTYTYDTYGNRNSVTDPAGDKTTYTFDSVGRALTKVSPNGNVTGGNPAAYTTNYTTDAFGDVLTMVDPLGDTTTYVYDANRNLKSVTDPNLHVTSYTYDLDDEQTKVTRQDTTTQQTSYDADGEVTGQINGLNNTTSYTYDALGDRITMTDALNRTSTYTYDGNGNLLTLVDPSSRTTSYRYDAASQLTAITYSDGTTPSVTFNYDLDGQRLSMSDGSGTSTYAYDSLRRLVQSINGNNKTVGYAYNLRGLLTTLTYPGGSAVTRGYDNAGRLTSVADWLTHTTAFGYDADSNLTTETYPNGTIGSFTFDNADRVMSTVDSLSGTQFLSLTYHRDAAGQLTQGSATQQYGYDTVNRVNSWTSSGANTTYGYDAADEITGITGTASTTMGYDVAGQVGSFVTSSGGNTIQNLSYSYDSQGNRTQVTDNIAHTSTTLGYDQDDRLKSYSASSTYLYDGNGLRASKTVSGTTTNYAWDVSGGPPLMILANSTDWIYGPGGFVLEQVTSTNTVYYYHQDQLGSTRKVTDSTGTVVRSYTFDPWGNVSSTTGTLSTPFQFAGQYTDMESGLYYLRARYYDPSSGQFITMDPMTSTTRQPYAYVMDTPLNKVDPGGLCVEDLCIVEGGFVIATAPTWGPIVWGAVMFVGAAVVGYVGANVLHADAGPSPTERQEDGRPGRAAQDLADKAWREHRGDWGDCKDAGEVADKIQDIMDRPNSKQLPRGDRQAWWDSSSGRVIIYDPYNPSGGTAFRPPAGKSYYDNL